MRNKTIINQIFAKTFLGLLLSALLFASWGTARADLAKPWGIIADGSLRFVVLASLNNQAVLDKETGLIWERTPSQTGSVAFAVNSCDTHTVFGKHGWRLPTVQELANLLTDEDVTPKLPTGHPFQGISGTYWTYTITFTPVAADVGKRRIVDMDTGDITLASQGEQHKRWCVRGGSRGYNSNADTQTQ